MSKRLNLFSILLLVAVVGLLGRSEALAQSPGDDAVASVDIGSTTITWQSRVGSDGIVLKISGPNGFSFQDEFSGGENPTFRFSDKPDGAYTYELTTVPAIDDEVRRAIESVTEETRSAVEQQLREAGKLPQAQSQTGAFYVAGGSVVNNDTDEIDPDKDNVVLDDQIVTGSLCTGFDCVNGENFGFDTLRLKENNLRIHFNDTSTSGSFPSNDWRITINDTSNGGSNYFAIEDATNGRIPFRVEAGAPANTLYVEADGDVGVKTANPVVDVHIVDGNTPTVRLQQDGSSGFTAQTWDVAGNEANFFIRDATNSSKIPFKIIPNAPTNSLYVAADGNIGLGTNNPAADLHIRDTSSGDNATLRLEQTFSGSAWEAGVSGTNFFINETTTNNGNIGLGTTNPQRKLHIVGPDGAVSSFPSVGGKDLLIFENNSNSNIGIVSSVDSTAGTKWYEDGGTSFAGALLYFHSNNTMRFYVNGSSQMTLDSSGNLDINGALSQTSNVNAKEDFVPVDSQAVLEQLADLPISTWSYKDDATGSRHMGPMAQDFYTAFELGQDDRHIAPLDTSGAAIAAIQALYELSQEKDARIAALEQENAKLESRLDVLEELVNTLVEQQ